ncbi:hypothetical protein OG196_31785 [Kitasatospora purpeofusca]|uniref:hypothetical protein n=1 Tax=Kitasatospora purpeofusca TaxID=67352 RepID=UPI002E0E70C5|nr:hypothetical protein OG196_31785 [Kitasatospora purpeofusca]
MTAIAPKGPSTELWRTDPLAVIGSYYRGATGEELREWYGISSSGLHRLLKYHHVVVRPPRRAQLAPTSAPASQAPTVPLLAAIGQQLRDREERSFAHAVGPTLFMT